MNINCLNTKGFKVSFNDTEGLWVATSKLNTFLCPPLLILMRNRTHQPWLNLPSVCVCLFFFLFLAYVCVCVRAREQLCFHICKYALVLCKVAARCQGADCKSVFMFDLKAIRLLYLAWRGFWLFITNVIIIFFIFLEKITSYGKDEKLISAVKRRLNVVQHGRPFVGSRPFPFGTGMQTPDRTTTKALHTCTLPAHLLLQKCIHDMGAFYKRN